MSKTTMREEELIKIIKNYRLPKDIQEFIKNNPIKPGKQYAGWYSDNGKLKIGKVRKHKNNLQLK